MEKKFIGFDLGAESGRCVVAVLRDKRITLHEVYRFKSHNVELDNGLHWNILAIYEEMVKGLANARKSFGEFFDGIGVDAWGVDYVIVDEGGRILGYPYHYRDQRTDGMMEQAFRIAPKETIYSKVGIQFLQFNTLFQLLAEKERKPNLLDLPITILLIPDFLNFMLTGNRKAEFTIASTTGLADPVTRDWCWELIDEFRLPRYIFPNVVEPGVKLGSILPSIAKAAGLDPATPVFATAGHDTASAVVSVPALEEKWAFLSSGTWSLIGVEMNRPLLAAKAMEHNFTNEGGIQGTTRFLKNIIGLWPVQECRRFWHEKLEECDYSALTLAAKADGCARSWIDLSDSRFFKPGNMPEKVIAYLRETDQAIKPGPGFIIRVVLESLAFSYRKAIEQIETISGNKIEMIHAVGGGIQNELLTQLTADATGCALLAGPAEGTVVGNIGVQAMASGAVSNLQAWRELVANSFELKRFDPISADYFDENEGNYERILGGGL